MQYIVIPKKAVLLNVEDQISVINATFDIRLLISDLIFVLFIKIVNLLLSLKFAYMIDYNVDLIYKLTSKIVLIQQ